MNTNLPMKTENQFGSYLMYPNKNVTKMPSQKMDGWMDGQRVNMKG